MNPEPLKQTYGDLVRIKSIKEHVNKLYRKKDVKAAVEWLKQRFLEKNIWFKEEQELINEIINEAFPDLK